MFAWVIKILQCDRIDISERIDINQKNVSSKFDDYSNLPRIRQILLHWGYELIEKDFFLTWWTNV